MKVDRKGLKVTLARLIVYVFCGYRIIETTANGRDLFEAIAHQLVAGTYNVPAPSHIIRSVFVSYVRENPTMTAEVTPEAWVCIIIMYAP